MIGCGIGGASVALSLAEIGFDVEFYDATLRARDHHGWVTLGPSTMTGLDRLGVGNRVWAEGFPVANVHTVDTVTGGVTDFSRYEATHRYPSTHVWRRDLLSILRDRLDKIGITCHYDSIATVGDLDADVIVGADKMMEPGQPPGKRSVTSPNLSMPAKSSAMATIRGPHRVCRPVCSTFGATAKGLSATSQTRGTGHSGSAATTATSPP